MTRWCVLTAVFLGWATGFASAQPTSRLERARERSKPRLDPDDERRRQRQNALIDADRIRDDIFERGLLRKRDGYYVLPPDRYRPDHWSPRFRPTFDFSEYGFLYDAGRQSRRSSSRRRPGLSRMRRARPRGYYYGADYWRRTAAAAYEQGRYDADHEYNDYIAAQRAAQLLDARKLKVGSGMRFFIDGQYDRAAIAWLGAAEVDHTDAACRVHAGHALFAVGRYADAVKLLARGFELAPHLATSTFDIRKDYGRKADFDAHLATLETFSAEHPDDADAATLLGYVQMYTAGPSASYASLRQARRLRPEDMFVEKLWNVAKMTQPQADVKRQEPQKRPKAKRQLDRAAPVRKREQNRPAEARKTPVRQVRADAHR